jgi:hypothetical protein
VLAVGGSSKHEKQRCIPTVDLCRIARMLDLRRQVLCLLVLKKSVLGVVGRMSPQADCGLCERTAHSDQTGSKKQPTWHHILLALYSSCGRSTGRPGTTAKQAPLADLGLLVLGNHSNTKLPRASLTYARQSQIVRAHIHRRSRLRFRREPIRPSQIFVVGPRL